MTYQITNMSVPRPFGLWLINPCFPHLWSAAQRAVYTWKWDLGDGFLAVPAGYECDGASIPFMFYNVVDPIAALIGAFLHDMLYETQGGFREEFMLCGKPAHLECSSMDTDPNNPSHHERRARADNLLKAAWIAGGMSVDMAEKGYLTVRLCGGPAWNSEEPTPSMLPLNEALMGAIK